MFFASRFAFQVCRSILSRRFVFRSPGGIHFPTVFFDCAAVLLLALLVSFTRNCVISIRFFQLSSLTLSSPSLALEFFAQDLAHRLSGNGRLGATSFEQFIIIQRC